MAYNEHGSTSLKPQLLLGSRGRRVKNLGYVARPCFKTQIHEEKISVGTGEVVQSTGCLPSRYKGLGSIPSITYHRWPRLPSTWEADAERSDIHACSQQVQCWSRILETKSKKKNLKYEV